MKANFHKTILTQARIISNAKLWVPFFLYQPSVDVKCFYPFILHAVYFKNLLYELIF